METFKTQSASSNKTYTEPAKLSKAAIWRKNNPNGMFTVVDWRAVNQ